MQCRATLGDVDGLAPEHRREGCGKFNFFRERGQGFKDFRVNALMREIEQDSRRLTGISALSSRI